MDLQQSAGVGYCRHRGSWDSIVTAIEIVSWVKVDFNKVAIAPVASIEDFLMSVPQIQSNLLNLVYALVYLEHCWEVQSSTHPLQIVICYNFI